MGKFSKTSSAGDTFTPYYGEFLVSPVPLELSFNWCSHNCGYCFANLGKPDRIADIKATMALLCDYQRRSTLSAHLLKQGYPTLVSNRVDPFADTNYRQFLPILELMVEMGLPVSIQTKGGKGVDQALKQLPPSVWYVTIETDSDEFSKKLAPGAPKISDRFELIKQLKANGHEVVVGVNPAVPEWISKPKILLEKLKSIGVHGVWSEILHFNSNQSRNLSDRFKSVIGEEVVRRASVNKKEKTSDEIFLRNLLDMAEEAGLQPFSIGQARRSDFFEPYHRLYEKTFPTMQDWVNHCFSRYEFSSSLPVLQFQEWADFMTLKLPSGIHQTGHYICSSNYSICKEYAKFLPNRKWNHDLTYREILDFAWNDNAIHFSPGACYAFVYLVNESMELFVDEADHPLMTWDKMGSEKDFLIVEETPE